MTRFYFHILNTKNISDTEGQVLADLDAAKREALTYAGAVLRAEKPVDIWQGQRWRLIVTDSPVKDGGRTLLTLHVTATDNTL